MANTIPLRPKQTANQMVGEKPIAIVASLFNKEYVDALLESCIGELKELLPNTLVHIARVPGAFEIPATVKHMSNQDVDFCCYITLGVIIQGETEHGTHVAGAVTHGLMDISIQQSVPIINEVLHVGNDAQAQARCMDSELNRGIEAARSAFTVLETFEELKS